ncbi:MAG TPA: response regulator transcription factor [Acidimicrobiales bacterium]|nr:response regulator transcription factor [Acidimicrobiales bacterium]
MGPSLGHLRVLVVDDHSLVRQGTHDILERDPCIDVVGEAADGEEAIALVDALLPDVVLMDIGLPGMSGLDATRRIRHDHPEVNVLALTIHDDDEYVIEMLEAGAAGYLLKDVRNAELVQAVLAVGSGEVVLHPAATGAVLGRLRGRPAEGDGDAEALSCRERAVLQLVADGLDNRAIADRLDVSLRTVEAHLSHAFRKLGVHSRTGAVVTAMRLGQIGSDMR